MSKEGKAATTIDDPDKRRTFYFRSKPPGIANKISSKEADALLAQELNQLSFEDRDSLFQELHGVPIQDNIVNKETPEFREKSIQDLTNELESTHKTNNKIFALAQSRSPEYVDSLKLSFLRTESYNIQSAAQRLVSYLEALQTLFGDDVVGRQVTIQDFHDDPESVRAIECGFAQLLPSRDRAGRAILFICPRERTTANLRYLFRCMVYFFQSAMQDEETQKTGMVIVNYNLIGKNGKTPVTDRHLLWHTTSMLSAMPLRLICAHYCYSHESKHITFIKLFAGAMGRRRIRFHQGSDLECQYELATFGIPLSCLPVTPDGELKSEYHLEWLLQQRFKEDKIRQQQQQQQGQQQQDYQKHLPKGTLDSGGNNDSTNAIVVIPNRHDVLLGRGKTIAEHAGNLRLHFLVGEYGNVYDKAEKLEKTELTRMIISQLNGRFLKKVLGGWIVVNEEIAREKVSHTFRTRRGRPTTRPPTSNNNNNNNRMCGSRDNQNGLLLPVVVEDNNKADDEQERAKRVKIFNN